MALWRGESERESAGGAGESAAGQRAASGAAWSRAAGRRRRERGAPGPLGAERRASSRRQHGAVISHRPAAPASGTAGCGEAGCALADGSSARARALGKEQRRPQWPAPWARGPHECRAAGRWRARSANFARRLRRPQSRRAGQGTWWRGWTGLRAQLLEVQGGHRVAATCRARRALPPLKAAPAREQGRAVGAGPTWCRAPVARAARGRLWLRRHCTARSRGGRRCLASAQPTPSGAKEVRRARRQPEGRSTGGVRRRCGAAGAGWRRLRLRSATPSPT